MHKHHFPTKKHLTIGEVLHALGKHLLDLILSYYFHEERTHPLSLRLKSQKSMERSTPDATTVQRALVGKVTGAFSTLP